MALVVADRVLETGTVSTGTGSVNLAGANNGYQSFVGAIGSGNTTYYAIYDSTSYSWEVGIGTVTSGTPNTLSRTTVLSSSNSGSLVSFSTSDTLTVFSTYPTERAIYGDVNKNVAVNNLSPGYTAVATTGGTTTLTATATYLQNFTGTNTQTVKLPDETTIPTGTAYIIDNDSTGNITVQDSGGNTLATAVNGAAGYFYSKSNSTATGNWAGYAFMPNNVQWGSGGLPAGYGGTGQTSLTANNVILGNGTSAVQFVAPGTSGNVLQSNGTTWNSAAVVTSFTSSSGLSTNTSATGAVSVTNTGVTSAAAGTGISVSASTGGVTITNSGVTSAVAGTGISVSGSTGAVTITNGGVTSLTGTSNQVSVSSSTGSVTLSTPQSIGTGSSVQFGSFGVGTAASGTTGEIRATNNVTAYYSDGRLKDRIGTIENALDKVKQLTGFLYKNNDVAKSFGYTSDEIQVGLDAQEVEKVQPEVVAPAPFDIGQNEDGTEFSKSGENYLTVRYERLIPLLVEAIKDLSNELDEIKTKL